jgi:hypothetical protein
MTKTSQLDAYIAVIQLDNLLKYVVMSYLPTRQLLVDEARERFPDDNGRRALGDLLTRYRVATLELAETLVALRDQCGTDPDDLPFDDDEADVLDTLERLRVAHAKKGGAG